MDQIEGPESRPRISRIVKKPLLLLASCLLAALPVASTLAQPGNARQLPMTELPLTELGAFRPAAGNWKIAGDVTADLDKKGVLNVGKGQGVLVNQPDDKNKDNLTTTFEHGDIDLEMDFMMAAGSNSGVYLQGRYEIQLLDSWGVRNPKAGDCGGIYERWDDAKPEGQKGYEGYPPRLNAAKAPGLWQTMKISFQAPRFDGSGKKTANARMLRVELNGVTIHENVELTGPTRGGMNGDEKPMGPLLIQGDHGPVAFRRIRYKNYTSAPVTLAGLRYGYYPGKFDKMPNLQSLKAEKEGALPELTWNVVPNPEDRFIVRLTGTMKIPQAGPYLFTAQSGGSVNLTVAGKKAIEQFGSRGGNPGLLELAAGDQPFEIVYYKPEPWVAPALGLYVESATLRRQPLHVLSSVPSRNPVDPILAHVGGSPRILRSFVDFRKEPNGPAKRVTHAASVGMPDQVSYTFDLSTGALVYVWKGSFLDATPMWNSRGDGSSRPMGSVVALGTAPVLAVLGDRNAAWPDTVPATANFRSRGYDLDENGNPVFRYATNGVEVEDQLRSEENGKYLTREMRLNGTTPGNLYGRIAEGRDITEVGKGLYAVDGKAYYVRVPGDAKATVRKTNDRSELLLPVQGNALRYSILW